MTESNQSLTIALICNLYPPYIVGGNEILARDVAEALRARGHTVHILTGYGSELPHDSFTHGVLDINLDRKADVFLGGLPLTAARVMRWKIFNERTYRRVRTTLHTLRPDMVIAWNLYQASMAPLAAARGGPWPVVAHPADKWLIAGLWDVGLQVPVHNRKQRLALAFLRSVVQPLVRQFAMPDYVLAVSEFIRQLHVARGFPADRSLATYLGVPADMFAYRERTFPGERPWRLVFAAQLWHGKGPQVAIEAVARLRARNDVPPVVLDMYGSGTDNFMAFLHKKIADLGVHDAVRVHGFVPRVQLARVFQEGDAYLFCSIWDEPFSGGLLEALATGIPTIATTTGGTPEAIRDGENGVLVPPDDPAALEQAIVRLMRDAELYQRLSQNGAADVRQRWTFDRYIDRLERVYTAIVQAHRRGEHANLTALAAQVAPYVHG